MSSPTGRSADPSTPVRLDVERRLAPGRLTETMTVTSWLDQPITLRLAVGAGPGPGPDRW